MREPSLHERALRCLARRDYSRAELARKLAPHGSAEEIEAVLARMSELSLQSDARMAANWVRSRAGRLGGARLRNELARRGVAGDLIEAALTGEEVANELERARVLWRAKFGTAPADAREWVRQARFLYARGFAAETVHAALCANPADESEGDGEAR
ncbi:MAG: recombination regulator RecX [Azoarcus sp.]|jgi:regulatory protein|nr:recombination regulator RecX [Azoarcus sp.]